MDVRLSVVHLRDCLQMPPGVRALRFEQLFVHRKVFAARSMTCTRGTHKQFRRHGLSEPERLCFVIRLVEVPLRGVINRKPWVEPKLGAPDVNQFLQKVSITPACFRSN